MNPKATLLLFLLVAVCCHVTLGQEPSGEQASQAQDRINEDVKNLKALQAEIAKTLKNIDGPSEMDVRASAVGARQIALGLYRSLGLPKISVVSEKQSEPASDSPRNTLRSLDTLLTDLIKAPDNARKIDALIEFTEPVQLEFNKDHPLAIRVLMDLLLAADKEKTFEIVEPKVTKLVHKRCVDFVDNGTNFWALKTLGASEALLKEIDTCLSAENRAIILNRLAATPESELTVSKATVFGDVIRSLYIKKDIANRKRFLEAGREFIRRFGDELCAAELVEWLKITIPKVETAIEKMSVSK